ncbi:conserved hypothetical protein [Talaromyces stipitatus ATCC 10500]|uniref:GAT domain-containing protein n=1 Tax=Talaromyces stipitatus (strain ATCC 10500 / CBS 375.48 / QM 6759 / NRRL 1006) TaxID=441959 RepID=B8M1U6_TALSN|nr:uncharacterized protein TSTA_085550 [Talaromyces stipitatus ATCC 10500]EED21324.1 conserved hypothetical protein [Talaromyces stipitatus ATCC 10500]
MKRMFSGLQRRVTSPLSAQDSPSPTPSGNDSPEAIIAREIKAFCESGGGPTSASNDYLHLPAIVEAAESSANAAKEAAARIRKYLSSPAKVQGGIQYNSIMLIRILSENPGHTFTRNFDAKFVSTIRDLLREGRDMPAQQMLREMLDMFETQKSWDEDLAGLVAMWQKEKQKKSYTRSPPPLPGQQNPQFQQSGFLQGGPPRRGGQLPPADELASRISEARTSANLLIQLAQSTPAAEVQSHELMREFSQRCQSASRSIQNYMAVENPPPDENTMLTLIETNEQLSVALSKYQRTLLNARKALGASTPVTTPGSNSNVASPAVPPVSGNTNGNYKGGESGILIPELGNENLSSANTAGGSVRPSVHASLDTPFSLPGLDRDPVEVPAEAPSTRTIPTLTPSNTQQPATATTSNRYEYNPDEFNVENPFADSTTEDSHGHGYHQQQEPTRRAV